MAAPSKGRLARFRSAAYKFYCTEALQVPLAELKLDPTPKDEHDQVPEPDAGPL